MHLMHANQFRNLDESNDGNTRTYSVLSEGEMETSRPLRRMRSSALERLGFPSSRDRGYAAYSRRVRRSVGGKSVRFGALHGARE